MTHHLPMPSNKRGDENCDHDSSTEMNARPQYQTIGVLVSKEAVCYVDWESETLK